MQTKSKKTPLHPQTFLRIDQFSKKFRVKAVKLLKLLKESDKIGYNELMEMVYENKPVKHSNIVTLIEHALSRYNSSHPKGIRRFYKLLNEIGVPNTLVKNKMGRKLMQNKLP